MSKFIIGNEYILKQSCQTCILHCNKKTPKTVVFRVENMDIDNQQFELQRLKIFYDDNGNEFINWNSYGTENVIVKA